MKIRAILNGEYTRLTERIPLLKRDLQFSLSDCYITNDAILI